MTSTPSARALDRVHALAQATGTHLLPAEPWLARLLHIATAQIERVDAKPPRNLVDVLLATELDLRLAEAAEGTRAQLIGIGDLAMCLHSPKSVGSCAHAQHVAQDARTVVGVGAAVEDHFDFARDEGSV